MAGRLHRIVNTLEHALPGVPFDRVLPWRRRIVAAGGVTKAPTAAIRLLIGPENSAGQGTAWARAAATLDGVGAANLMIASDSASLHFSADHRVSASIAAHSPWRRAEARAVREFTHVLIESGKPLYGGAKTTRRHISLLQDAGISVGLVWHGSDIRVPSIHARDEPDSPFGAGSYPEQEWLEQLAEANLRLAADIGQNFVSTPDLLDAVPQAQWLPVVIDVDEWSRAVTTHEVLERRRPVVVHAPSKAIMKGSARVAVALHELHDEGLIEYREVSRVSRQMLTQIYGDADIVLDQFLLGSYGTAACEAMGAGRLVIGHVSNTVRERIRSMTGQDLPIVSARAADVGEVIRAVLSDRERYRTQAAHGKAFVQSVHSGALSAAVLSDFLGTAQDSQLTHGRLA